MPLALGRLVAQTRAATGSATANPVAWRRSKTNLTAIEPSPIAVATLLIEWLRTSPTQNTPGRLVSNKRGTWPGRSSEA